jgi:uncharacterized protein YcbK (DUF882 family)
MTKLSKNFNLDEFLTSAGLVLKPTPQQVFCLQTLVTRILQPVRDEFGPMKITSGLRTKESNEALIKKGYPASKTSDHLAWCDVNPTGTGAADFNCTTQTNMKIVFDWIIENISRHCRQIIYYPDMNVIHVSNHFNNIFKMEDSILVSNKILIKTKDKGFAPYTK